jgi:hypothetical protein
MKFIPLLFLFVFISACSTAGEDRTIGTDMIDIPASSDGDIKSKQPKIEFEQSEIDAGRIAQGEILDLVYRFKNTGSAPLVISSVDGSCGCSIPKTWPSGKILPGESGEIEIEFNSDGKAGPQTITISVVTNTVPSLTQLLIKTDIAAPDNFETK